MPSEVKKQFGNNEVLVADVVEEEMMSNRISSKTHGDILMVCVFAQTSFVVGEVNKSQRIEVK